MSKSASATNYSDAVLDVRPITPAIGAEIPAVSETASIQGE
jgi:hypothetical protein